VVVRTLHRRVDRYTNREGESVENHLVGARSSTVPARVALEVVGTFGALDDADLVMRPWVLWVAVFVAGVGGLWMIKGHVSSRDRSAGYEAAPACAEGRPAPECRTRETATITDKAEKRSGSRTYRFELRVADGTASVMVTASQYEALATGQSLDVERWQGRVTRIYRAGTPEPVVQTPRRRTGMLVSGIVSVVAALGLMWLALRRRK